MMQIEFDQHAYPAENKTPSMPMRAGEVCPFCGQGIVDYDGMLSLVCPVCGKEEGGCFT